MNPHMIMARRRVGIHPGYARAVQAKPETPPEVYSYPALVRGIGPRRCSLTVPARPQHPPAPSYGWYRVAYVAVLLALWVVVANVKPGV
ncbi:hypothetical protein [Castellaniella caeni]|uniref:hypothetical protein n=1 Tax=Castellaniella caeni TaxID=266123 RepID=UPI0011AEF631|nr:hypothetical protein [Castellaniella caeni]